MPPFTIGKPVETKEAVVDVTVDPANPLPPGQHIFTLVVVDSAGNPSKSAKVTVIVRDDVAPTAVLTAPSPVSIGQSFKLDGSGSFDLAPGQINKYIWTMES
jgi:hypothetical protein